MCSRSFFVFPFLFLVAHVKDIEVKETKADMERIKLGHRNDMQEHMQRKYDAEVVHTNVIAKSEVTYQEKVNQLVEYLTKEVNLLKDVQAADLSELC
jgi:hypothetical protein